VVVVLFAAVSVVATVVGGSVGSSVIGRRVGEAVRLRASVAVGSAGESRPASRLIGPVKGTVYGEISRSRVGSVSRTVGMIEAAANNAVASARTGLHTSLPFRHASFWIVPVPPTFSD
jgi:hypothetical protein